MATGGAGFHASAAALDALARTVDHSARERAQPVDLGFFPLVTPQLAERDSRLGTKSRREASAAAIPARKRRTAKALVLARPLPSSREQVRRGRPVER